MTNIGRPLAALSSIQRYKEQLLPKLSIDPIENYTEVTYGEVFYRSTQAQKPAVVNL